MHGFYLLLLPLDQTWAMYSPMYGHYPYFEGHCYFFFNVHRYVYASITVNVPLEPKFLRNVSLLVLKDECRVFNKTWTEVRGKVVCLVCGEQIVV